MFFLFIFTVISLALIIHAFLNNNEGWQIVSILILICVGIIGWGAWACTGTNKESKSPAKIIEILKGKHVAVVVTDDGKEHVFKGYEIDKLSDTTKFYWKRYYNYYNIDKTSETELIHD